jgi:hypothetical protein
MLSIIHSSLVAWLCAGWLVAMCLALAFVLPLCKVAKHAAADEELAATLAPTIDRLTEVRGPSGQPFFATPHAEEELVDELWELAVLGR